MARPSLLLPDVRGLHPFYEELALRFAEHGVDALAIDWFGRTARDDDRGEGFEHMPHVAATTWGGIAADIAAGVAYLREHGRGAGAGSRPPCSRSASAWAGGCRSWPGPSGSTWRA